MSTEDRSALLNRIVVLAVGYAVSVGLVVADASSSLAADPTAGPGGAFFLGLLGLFVLGFRATSVMLGWLEAMLGFRFYLPVVLLAFVALFAPFTVPLCVVVMLLQYGAARVATPRA